jgi:ethanolamine utilization cobalamin adenosyltransferase
MKQPNKFNSQLQQEILGSFQQLVKTLIKTCRYYFEMSHLIPNLKCHIERVSSLYLQGGDSNEKMSDFGG